MNLARFLVDTSALVRILRDHRIRVHWEQQITAGLVAVCPMVELELLYSARSTADRSKLVTLLHTAFNWVPMPEAVFDEAVRLQGAMTESGTHRSAGAVDWLITATASRHNLVLLHYDRDFETVAKVTGQPTQWLAPAGSIS